jgi:ribosome-associated toxin RatA of RatAB toxin-antitoxin module
MASTSSTATVAAPRARVMAVIADFAAYPQWVTAIQSAEVTEAGPDGRASRVRFSLDAGVIKDTYILSYTWDGDSAVQWQLAEPGSVLTVMDGAYRLAGDSGATTVRYDLTVELRIPLPGILKRRAEKAITDAALRGLKTRAENQRAG